MAHIILVKVSRTTHAFYAQETLTYIMIYREEKNFIEAASNGASLAISLVANIAANLIAFIALLHFVDSTLTWMGHRAGLYEPELTFRVNHLCDVHTHSDSTPIEIVVLIVD